MKTPKQSGKKSAMNTPVTGSISRKKSIGVTPKKLKQAFDTLKGNEESANISFPGGAFGNKRKSPTTEEIKLGLEIEKLLTKNKESPGSNKTPKLHAKKLQTPGFEVSPMTSASASKSQTRKRPMFEVEETERNGTPKSKLKLSKANTPQSSKTSKKEGASGTLVKPLDNGTSPQKIENLGNKSPASRRKNKRRRSQTKLVNGSSQPETETPKEEVKPQPANKMAQSPKNAAQPQSAKKVPKTPKEEMKPQPAKKMAQSPKNVAQSPKNVGQPQSAKKMAQSPKNAAQPQSAKKMAQSPENAAQPQSAKKMAQSPKNAAQPQSAKKLAQFPKNAAQPQSAKKMVQSPKNTAQPQSAKKMAQSPKNTAQPQSAKKVAQSPKNAAQSPKNAAQSPKNAAQPPKNAAQPPKNAAQQQLAKNAAKPQPAKKMTRPQKNANQPPQLAKKVHEPPKDVAKPKKIKTMAKNLNGETKSNSPKNAAKPQPAKKMAQSLKVEKTSNKNQEKTEQQVKQLKQSQKDNTHPGQVENSQNAENVVSLENSKKPRKRQRRKPKKVEPGKQVKKPDEDDDSKGIRKMTMKSSQEALKYLNQIKTSQAAEALLKLNAKSDASKKKLFKDSTQKITMQINTIKPVETPTRFLRIPLEYPIIPTSSEVCLFVADVEGARNQPEVAEEQCKNLLQEKGVKGISEVISFKRLKLDYSQYEAKRKLANQYDIFLVDSKICNRIIKVLGKHFIDNHKIPTPVSLIGNVEKNVQHALSKSIMKITTNMDSFHAQVGHTDMTANELTENLNRFVWGLDQLIPGHWRNVRSLFIKSEKTKLLPVYVSALPKNKVPNPIVKSPKNEIEPVKGELSTMLGASVVVYPSGDIRVRKSHKKEDSDEEIVKKGKNVEEEMEAEADEEGSDISESEGEEEDISDSDAEETGGVDASGSDEEETGEVDASGSDEEETGEVDASGSDEETNGVDASGSEEEEEDDDDDEEGESEVEEDSVSNEGEEVGKENAKFGAGSEESSDEDEIEAAEEEYLKMLQEAEVPKVQPKKKKAKQQPPPKPVIETKNEGKMKKAKNNRRRAAKAKKNMK